MSSSVEERPSSSSSSSGSASSYFSATAGRENEIDPLLKDLNEKKQSFRRNVASLAAELKEVRSRLFSQEQSYARETLTRQEAENKAKKMEEEINKLQRNLEETNRQLLASASTSQEYLKELDNLRSQLSATQATVDASATSAQCAQCRVLLKELSEKNYSVLKELGEQLDKNNSVSKELGEQLEKNNSVLKELGVQLDLFGKHCQAMEFSQKQLKDDMLRTEHHIMEALAKADANMDCKLRKIRDEISQLKGQEVCSQTQKIRRMLERQEKAMKEHVDQLATKQSPPTNMEKPNFLDAGFKIVVVSILILVFSKR